MSLSRFRCLFGVLVVADLSDLSDAYFVPLRKASALHDKRPAQEEDTLIATPVILNPVPIIEEAVPVGEDSVEIRAYTNAVDPEQPESEKDFVDVSSSAFPDEWKHWDHVGRPRGFCGTPVFPDINGDGVLDFFYHNHYQLHPSSEWDLGISDGSNRPNGSNPWFRSVGEKAFVSTEKDGSEYMKQEMDTHGSVFLDIDRDGWLDLYVSVGGGNGLEFGKDKNSALFWGEQPDSGSGIQRFRGGRDVAELSHLENKDARGRFTYFVDFDQDGLLDIVFANDVRLDEKNTFGYAMMNRGNRTFEPDYSLSEYSQTMMLHDANGDGYADEFVVQRRNCLPAPYGKWETKQVPEPTEERLAFCEDRPVGTAAVYKYNRTLGRLEMISPPRKVSEVGELSMPWSMQSGDFDGDGKADLAVLRETGIHFYYSHKRPNGGLPIGEPSKKVEWPKHDCEARALRVGDLDLDGKQELVVMCAGKGRHRIYTQDWDNDSGDWRKVEAPHGDLSSNSLPMVNLSFLQESCHGSVDGFRVYVQNLCQLYWKQEKLPDPRPFGISLIDWNNDGFLDMTLTHDFGSLLMLENRNKHLKAGSHQFLAVKLIGTKSNVYGIGATVLVQARDMGPANVTTTQLREVYSAMHETDWWGSRDDRLIFGLGAYGRPLSVVVRWPSGIEQVVDDQAWLAEHTNSMSNLLLIREKAAEFEN